MFIKTTHNVKVIVVPAWLEGQSDPENGLYTWAYTIRVENRSEKTVQLLSRYWHITDSNGSVQQVEGVGVVGEQPVMKPMEAFQYTSGVSLKTPSGVMRGHYEMTAEDGELFKVEIPIFSLDSPEQLARPN